MAGRPGRSGGHNKLSLREHVIRGTYNATRHGARPVSLTSSEGPITKPAELSEDAARMWDELAPHCVAMGTLTPADARAFALLCELQATMNRASALKNTPGQFLEGVALERQFANIIRGYYSLFGLDPLSRARLREPDTEAPVQKWAGALK